MLKLVLYSKFAKNRLGCWKTYVDSNMGEKFFLENNYWLSSLMYYIFKFDKISLLSVGISKDIWITNKSFSSCRLYSLSNPWIYTKTNSNNIEVLEKSVRKCHKVESTNESLFKNTFWYSLKKSFIK